MILTAFDPGKLASFAVFDTSKPWEIEIGEVRQTGVGRYIRPCAIHIEELVSRSQIAVIEEVGAMPKQGVSSMFTFGMSLGAILGAAQANAVPVEMVRPPVWKAASQLGGLTDGEGKTAARLYAKQLWPQHAKILDVKDNHGMADAALIARWYFLKGPGRDIPVDAACQMRS